MVKADRETISQFCKTQAICMDCVLFGELFGCRNPKKMTDSEVKEACELIYDNQPLPSQEAKERIIERETWRGKVLELAHEKGIGFKELAADYNLTSNTTAEEFKKVYEDLK